MDEAPMYAYPATPEIIEKEAQKFKRLGEMKPSLYKEELQRLQTYAQGDVSPPNDSIFFDWERKDFRALYEAITAKKAEGK